MTAPDPAEAAARLRACLGPADTLGRLLAWNRLQLSDIAAVLDDWDRLRAAVALHRPHPYPGCIHCAECDAFWPCPTVRAAGAT